jgi:glucose/arabinose dehydrogenase
MIQLPYHLITREFVWEKVNVLLYRQLFELTGYAQTIIPKEIFQLQNELQKSLQQLISYYSLNITNNDLNITKVDYNPYELLNVIYKREEELLLIYKSYLHFLPSNNHHINLIQNLIEIKKVQHDWLKSWKMEFSKNGWNEDDRYEGLDYWLEEGYSLELVADKLTFPTSIAFDDEGEMFIGESGFSYGPAAAEPRIIHIRKDGSRQIVASDFDDRPLTGLTWYKGYFYVITGGFNGKVYRISREGQKEVIIKGLRGGGDHYTSDIVFSSDGKMCFGVGTVTNTSVVGEDNYLMGWLGQNKDYHDIPARKLKLLEENFVTRNFLTKTKPKDKATTGPFKPFGVSAKEGENIQGQLLANGVIYRANPDGTNLEIIADGIRNMFGLAFSPDGKLYGTNNGMDFRGSRPVEGDWDSFYEIKAGWFGWPDFASGLPVTLPYFKPKGHDQPKFVLADPPPLVTQPLIRFEPHTATQKFDFCNNNLFAAKGEVFFAQFGDQSPMTGLTKKPKGYRVVRANPVTGQVKDFLVNTCPGEDSNGPERPLTPKFSPDGKSLYLVDFGLMKVAAGVIYPFAETGKLWRIIRK